MLAYPRLAAVVFLIVVSGAAGSFAWHVERTTAELLESQQEQALEKQAEWEKLLAAAEQRAKDLETELAAARSDQENPPSELLHPAAGEFTEAGPPRPSPGRRGDRLAANTAITENPEYNQLLSLQQRGQLDGRYADLLKKLHLSPASLSRFRELLAEKQNTYRDVVAAARQQGMDPRQNREQLQQLVAQANAEADQAILNLLGASGYSQYKTYEQTLPQRAVVNQLNTRLSYSGTPLNPGQTDQLLSILAETSPSPAATRQGARPGSGRVTITEQTLSRAEAVLAPDQVTALQQLQEEQQASQKMMQLLRQQRPSRPPVTGTPPKG